MNYFNLPAEYSSHENSKSVIVAVPYQSPNQRKLQTGLGPKAILEASQKINLFDDELWIEPYKIGIQSLPEIIIDPSKASTEKPFQQIYEAIKPLVEFEKFPVMLGGENSITLGAVRACMERFSNLSILQIGARSNLKKPDDKDYLNTACLGFNLYDMLRKPNITQVGVRDISAEEIDWLEDNQSNINIFWARQQQHWNPDEILKTLSPNVYLSIDVSAFDPSIMPATRTPQPGGLNWSQMIELIKLVSVHKQIVAADVVELAPIRDLPGPNVLLAKLIYKLIGYRFALELGVSKKY